MGAYVVCSVVGLVFSHFLGSSTLSQTLAVGGGILFMELFRLLHPPATAVALIIASNVSPPVFFLASVLGDYLILIAVGLIVNNIVPGRRYPCFW
jgi:CBS-domain-containing membrane protein